MSTTTIRTFVRGLAVAAILILPASARGQQFFPADDDLRLMLRYLVEDGEAPGIVVGILEADGSTRVVEYGDAGDAARPLGERSVFEIGSINKTFTGVLLADLVARGVVRLDDPVARYLPAGQRVPSRNGREITLLDLATHYSGLPRLPDNHTPADMRNPYADFTIEKLYAFLSSHELRRDPGAEGEYSNLGFGLLGHALARAAGTSYVDLVRDRILAPLGMDMTGYALEGDVAAWMVTGHDNAGAATPYWFATEAIHGAGGLRSNADDMLAYLDANAGAPRNDLERTMRAAHAFRRDVEDEHSIGLGWQRVRVGDRTIVNHGGGTGGFSTYIAFDSASGAGFVMLANQTAFGDDFGMDFLRRGAPLALPEIELSRRALARYVGAYRMPSGNAMHVRLEPEGWLTIQAPRNVRFRMYADSDTSFFLKRAPWRIAFTRDANGAVTGMSLNLDGQMQRAERTDDASPDPRAVAGNAPPAAPSRPASTPATPEVPGERRP